MFENNNRRMRKDALDKILSQKLNGIKIDVKEIFQVKQSTTKNNSYRSSTPWYTLLSESAKFLEKFTFTANNNFLCGFQCDNKEMQNLVDAAFSKALSYISDYEDLDLETVREMMVNFLLENDVMNKGANHIIKTIKKLDITVLSSY
jgi:hypothetical protein